jgi:putative tricarboxylic transport membrane protein
MPAQRALAGGRVQWNHPEEMLMQRLVNIAAAAVLAGGLTGLSVAAAAENFPEKPIKLIVPFGQGGSSASAARSMEKAVGDHDLLPVPMTISYVPGAAGTIGARQVKDADPDGYTILLWHVAMNGSAAMNMVDFGPADFEPFFGNGEKCYMLVVREASEYQTLDELLKAAQASPETIISADNLGGANHIASVLAEDQVQGAAFRHVQFGGTAKTYPALLGGHAEVNASSTSALANTTLKGLRVLGYMGPERHEDYPDVPTFREQGYDLDFCTFNWWLAPKGTPKDRLDALADALEKAMQTDYMKEHNKMQGVTDRYLRGQELVDAVWDENKKIMKIAKRLQGAE